MSIRHSNYRRVGKHTADERQRSLNPVMMLGRAARDSRKKPDQSRTGKPTFREDFLLEHTRFGQQVYSLDLAGCF